MRGDALDLRVRRLPRLHAVAAAPLEKDAVSRTRGENPPREANVAHGSVQLRSRNLSTGEGGGDYHLHSPAAAFFLAVVYPSMQPYFFSSSSMSGQVQGFDNLSNSLAFKAST